MQHHPRRVCSRSRRRSQSSGISDVVLLCLTCLVVRQAAGQEAREVPLPQAGPECVAVPGGTGSVVPPGRGQWGFLRLPLDPPLGPGLASLSLTYLADAQRSAAALIYAETPAGEHIPPYGLRLPSATDGQLHPLQQAFWEQQGLQCGFCTPAMVLAARQLLDAEPNPSEAQVREVLGGVEFAEQVHADESEAAGYGISGVPFFLFEGQWAVSGAQPAELFTQALDQVWAETHKPKFITLEGVDMGNQPAGGGSCGCGGCGCGAN